MHAGELRRIRRFEGVDSYQLNDGRAQLGPRGRLHLPMRRWLAVRSFVADRFCRIEESKLQNETAYPFEIKRVNDLRSN
jgi:hypothetical protein